MEKIVCSSCKTRITNLTGVVKFPCPKCADHTFVRCMECRKIVAKYTCPKCGFTGPN